MIVCIAKKPRKEGYCTEVYYLLLKWMIGSFITTRFAISSAMLSVTAEVVGKLNFIEVSNAFP